MPEKAQKFNLPENSRAKVNTEPSWIWVFTNTSVQELRMSLLQTRDIQTLAILESYPQRESLY